MYVCTHPRVSLCAVASRATPRLTRGPLLARRCGSFEPNQFEKCLVRTSRMTLVGFCTFGSATCCSSLHALAHLHQCTFVSVCRSSGTNSIVWHRFCMCGFVCSSLELIWCSPQVDHLRSVTKWFKKPFWTSFWDFFWTLFLSLLSVKSASRDPTASAVVSQRFARFRGCLRSNALFGTPVWNSFGAVPFVSQ